MQRQRTSPTVMALRLRSASGDVLRPFYNQEVSVTIPRAIVCLSLMFFAAIAPSAAAQSGSGVAAIEGTVIDPDNRAIAGARVIVISSETGYERVLSTDVRGRYFATAMPVGSYAVEVSAPGFAHVQQDAVRLTVGVTETINFALKVANVDETVTVTATVTRLDKDDPATSTVVGATAVSNLPIRGRDFTEFVQLTPGITQDSDRNGLVM